jgi:antitoxin YefM
MPLAIMMWSRAAMASAYTTRHTCPEAAKGTSSSEVSPMNATTVQEAKKNLDRLIEQVNADAEPTIICGDQGQKAVLLSLEEFNSWQETLYLLSNPANAEHLRQSIAEAQTGKTLERDLIDP